MKVAVVKDDVAWGIGLGEGEVLVEDKFECWVASKVALHLYAAIN